jgi:hypothetical protein
MTFLRLAARTVGGGGPLFITSSKTTNSAFASVSIRCYLGRSIKVSHYEFGWNADGVDETAKDIEKYCTQTFNKISQVVSKSSTIETKVTNKNRQSRRVYNSTHLQFRDCSPSYILRFCHAIRCGFFSCRVYRYSQRICTM